MNRNRQLQRRLMAGTTPAVARNRTAATAATHSIAIRAHTRWFGFGFRFGFNPNHPGGATVNATVNATATTAPSFRFRFRLAPRATTATATARVFGSTTEPPESENDMGATIGSSSNGNGNDDEQQIIIIRTSWNERVQEFLDSTTRMASSSSSSGANTNTNTNTNTHEQLTPDAAAETIQSLLDDLLRRIAAAANGGTADYDNDSGNFNNNALASNGQYTYEYNSEHDGQYLDWRTTELPWSSMVAEDSSNASAGSPGPIDETIDATLAFALMDRLLDLEKADDSALLYHTMQWGAHTSCLNPILQLWKRAHSPSPADADAVAERSSSAAAVPTPPEVLARLDAYRQHSNVLIPDVRSYNIILDAVATHNTNTNTNHNTAYANRRSGRAKPKHPNVNVNANVSIGIDVDVDFCQSLWQWMWEESSRDSLVRPDEITLRTMLKANVLTGHTLAPQRCEALVDEWAQHHYGHASATDPNQSNDDHDHEREQNPTPTLYDPKGTLLQSLIHVWALHDPDIAESYLRELARRYLAGESSLPPDAIAWNRVVSAHAIAHSHPQKGLRVLEDFWEFYRRAHGLDNNNNNNNNNSDSMKGSSSNSLDTVSSDSGSIDTKSNSLKLLNATVLAARKRAESDITTAYTDHHPPSSAVANAVWKVHPPNLGTYNALLEGFARLHNAREANKILEQLQRATSVAPSIATYTSAIKANGGDLERVRNLAHQCLDAYQEQQAEQEERQHGLAPDRAFFHAWLGACALARNVKEARAVLKTMKSLESESTAPNATTYRMLTDVFLSANDSQGAIEWLLAYAKLEGMSESAIVACTTRLLDWYRHHQSGGGGGGDSSSSSSGDVDSAVLLQILCENDFITRDESLQQLLLGISASQGRAVMGWLNAKKKSKHQHNTSMKLWAIVLRALSQEEAGAGAVEDCFGQLKEDPLWKETFDPSNPAVVDTEAEKLLVEIYSSIVVAWCKEGASDPGAKQRIQHWTEELEHYRDGALSLNLAAHVALVTMYCHTGDPLSAEQYVNGLQSAYEEGRISSPPDTMLCNMVLNAWAQKGNGSRAVSFFESNLKEPDAVSYNTVINAFARQGRLDEAEEWACKLVASFLEHPVESRRPQQATFTVLLAAWRRSRHPNAAERAEKVLAQMNELCDNDILLSKPNAKSYQTVLDAWGKSRRGDAAQRAERLVVSSGFDMNKKLRKKLKDIRSRQRKLARRSQNDHPSSNSSSNS